VPYELPAEVAAAIESIRAVAAQEPAPPPVPAAAEEGGKRQRRVLPRAIKDALAAFSPLYLQQTEAHGQVGQPGRQLASQPASVSACQQQFDASCYSFLQPRCFPNCLLLPWPLLTWPPAA
jgi:hypothetical protein